MFGLRKTWVDPGPGIEMVQVHYTWTPTGGEPQWEQADCAVLSRDDPGNPLRTAVIDVPRYVEGSPSYSLHHFFFVVGRGDRVASPVVTEEIVAREIGYEDAAGRYTHVGVAWNCSPGPPEWAVPNYTSAAMDGLTFEGEGADAGGLDGTAPAIYEFVHAQPLPHVFRALVWGPAGGRVDYVFHLVRSGSPDPAQDMEQWDDNAGGGWHAEL